MDTTKLIRPIAIDYSKNASERTITVLLKDKATGEIIGSKVITKAQLAKSLQPFGRTCHEALNGKFVLEV